MRLRHLACYRRSHLASTLLGFVLLGAILGYLQLHTRNLVTKDTSGNNKEHLSIFKKDLYTFLFTNESHSKINYSILNVTNVSSEQNITSFPATQNLKPYEWCSDESSQFHYNSTYAEDIMKYNISFIPEGYKNPCFYDVCKTVGSVSVRALRCLPYFHLIGVDKSGSTDLFARITQHPQVLPNLGVLEKETSWWPWTRYGHGLKKQVRKESFDKYLGYFDNAAGQIERTIQLNKKGSNANNHDFHLLITGDGTPMDFWDFSGWPKIPQNRNQNIPKILTPHLLKHVNPNVKLILVLRDPTERLYSDYLFLKSGVQTPKGFGAAVLQSLQYFKNCTERYSVRKCLFDRKLHTRVKARIHVSIYSVFLKEWLKVFPRKQILIIRSEDYSQNISSHLKNIFNFLGVTELAEKDITKIATRSRAYQTPTKKKIGPMLNSTRHRLDIFFQPFNEELVEILRDEKYLWLDTKEKIKQNLKKQEKRRLENLKNQINVNASRTISLTKEQKLVLKPFMDADDRNSNTE
ncbi:carbohydrate sulfotransferase 15-like [Ylistrum balloti]|uniref:carbohydrate sulfotransferase 15-like n=1 Tax=Ylistrum balloti TaxID=509963 RepID=UPI002905A743|nr:carbohydrate sulfotransferase 15-like [Ylistrum balloti]